MKFYPLVLMLLLLVPPALAADLNPWNVGAMEAEVTFTGAIDLEYENNGATLNWVEVELFMLPQENTYQDVELISATPESYQVVDNGFGNKIIKFRWVKPSADRLPFELRYNVTVGRFLVPLGEPGDFPPPEVSGLDAYLQPDNLTFWTGAMKNKAQELTKDATSSLEAVMLITNWIHGTLTYDEDYWATSEAACDVFKLSRGVCDEFTHLFLSFVKSLGIPGRYAEGIVFSGQEWDLHAWAEVFIGGRWVAVDPTYNEIGFIDSTHVLLANVPNDAYVYNRLVWEGTGVSANFADDERTIEVSRAEPPMDFFDVDVSLSKDSVVLDEVITADVSIESLATNSYMIPTCRLTAPDDMVLLDSPEKSVILEPSASADLSWRMVPRSDLDPRFLYKMPIRLSCFPGVNETRTLSVNPKTSLAGMTQVSIIDVTILSEDEVRATLMNEGTKTVGEITLSLCVENGDFECQERIVKALSSGEAYRQTFTLPSNLTGDEMLIVRIESEQFDTPGELRMSASGVQDTPAIVAIQLPRLEQPEREPSIMTLDEIDSDLILPLVIVAVILGVLIALVTSLKKH